MLYVGADITIPSSTTLAVSWEVLKEHLKQPYEDEEDVVRLYAGSAALYLEQQYDLVLISRAGCYAYFNRLPGEGDALVITRRPLTISAVAYNTIEAPDTWNAIDAAKWAAEYTDTGARVRVLKAWETTGTAYRVRVTFSAGYGAAATAVPSDIQHCIALLTAKAYANREDGVSSLPTTVSLIMRPYERTSV